MGLRSVTKYLALFSLAMGIVKKATSWIEEVTDEDSAGGEEITAAEWMSLSEVIADAIAESIGAAVDVKIIPDE